MKAVEVLQKQFGFVYRLVALNTEGMTAEAALVQPQPAGNCANWILAHLTGAQNGVMWLAGEAPVWALEVLEPGRLAPVTGPENALDWEDLRARFLESESRCVAALGRLTDADLDEGGFTDPFGQACTRGEFLALLAVHQLYHAGQLGVSRRLAGLEGAIRGPGEVSSPAGV